LKEWSRGVQTFQGVNMTRKRRAAITMEGLMQAPLQKPNTDGHKKGRFYPEERSGSSLNLKGEKLKEPMGSEWDALEGNHLRQHVFR